MIRLNRVKLINWHNFQDITIKFGDATFIFGVNGTGKTTIIDAIKYCLTTKEDFNAAGNKKSNRSLIGSIHQKQRSEKMPFLRKGHIVSYIACEFEDSQHNTFVIVSRLESNTPDQPNNGVSQEWYITNEHCMIEDIPYFVANTNTPTTKDKFVLNSNGKKMEKASNKKDARKRICHILGISSNNETAINQFINTFAMGTNLRDIKSTRDFMYSNILPEPSITLTAFKEEMEGLKELEKNLEIGEQELSCLQEIEDLSNDAQEKQKQEILYQTLIDYMDFKQKERQIGNIKDEISQNETRIQHLEKQSIQNNEERVKLRKALEGLNSDNQLDFLMNQQNEKIEEKNIQATNAQKYNDACKELKSLIVGLQHHGFISSIDIMPLFEDEKTQEEKGDLILEIKTKLKNANEKVSKLKHIESQKVEGIEKKIEIIDKSIEELTKGHIQYPREAIFIKDKINTLLKEEGREEEAKFFCELIEMKDKEWQNALESFLGIRRFNIIVSPENYLIAKKAFISIKNDLNNDISKINVGLIDTRFKYQKKELNNELSYLSQKAYCNNPYAQKYLEYLTSDVVCCDDANDLENYAKSITKDGLKFQSYCLQYMHFSSRFIGINIREEQLEEAKENKAYQNRELDKAKKVFYDIKKLNDDYENLAYEKNIFAILLNHCVAINKAREIEKEIRRIEIQIDEYKNNPMFVDVIAKRQEYEKKIKNSEEEEIDIKGNIRATKKNIKQKKEELEKSIYEYDELEKSLDYTMQKTIGLEKDLEKERKKNLSRGEINKRKEETRNETNKSKSILEDKQRYFNSNYNHDYQIGLECIEIYRNRKEHLIRTDIENNKKWIKAAKAKCMERFTNDVLCRLKDDITKSKYTLKPINDIMRELNYGGETYSFVTKKTSDKEFAALYDLIMKETKRNETDQLTLDDYAYTNVRTKEEETLIEDFMLHIMEEANETDDNGNLKGKYADYRTYLDYDIMVKIIATNELVPFSKVEGEGSGGETQVPFYIAMCASLLQIYNKTSAIGEESMRLILLDEAFNNMTSDRIEPVMDMFKRLNMQVVIIATTEKGSAIEPYCDTRNAVVKVGTDAIVREYVGSLVS